MNSRRLRLKDIHDRTVRFLADRGFSTAIQDTQILLMEALGFPRKIDIYLNSDLLLTDLLLPMASSSDIAPLRIGLGSAMTPVFTSSSPNAASKAQSPANSIKDVITIARMDNIIPSSRIFANPLLPYYSVW